MAESPDNSAIPKTNSSASEAFAAWTPGPAERRDMVEVAAYHIAEHTGFNANPRECWAAAEAQVGLMLALKENQKKLQAILATAMDAMVIMNAEGIITDWNTQAEKLFGWRREEAVGQALSEIIIPPRYREAHIQGMKHFLATGEGPVLNSRIEIIALHRDGHEFPVELSIAPIKLGGKYEFSAFIRDISERKVSEERMHHLAHYDLLTDLPNRTLFYERLQQALVMAKRDKTRLALMFIDLDKFKPINDTYGHNVGDLMLKEVAARLRGCMRESDTAARLGGDEFVVLLPTIETEQNAVTVAEKIRHALNQPFELTGESLFISSSTGIAIYPDHGSEAKLLLRNADAAMYSAKECGRNNVQVYRPKTPVDPGCCDKILCGQESEPPF